MKYFCCKDNRKDLVRGYAGLNGIDYVEVIDNPEDPDEIRQRFLHLYFLKDLTQPVTPENIKLKIEENDSPINVIAVNSPIPSSPPDSPPASPPSSPPGPSNWIEIELDQAGNFSIYTLCLVSSDEENQPMSGMDKILSCVDFSFKVACDTNSDCKDSSAPCGPEDRKDLQINYLAKDYASFRQLMLDRMSFLTPQWEERNAADLGIAMVELLAYAADYLSYRQDAIATEAYLKTARKRISVRRHARLVDYLMDEGNNARAWVRIEVEPPSDGVVLKKYFLDPGPSSGITDRLTTKFITGGPDVPLQLKNNERPFKEALRNGSRVFELMYDLPLYLAHNEMEFYTYGDSNCCLPKGATEATLQNHYPDLQVGDAVLLIEMAGPETGDPADADPTHRHVVRITGIIEEEDVNFDIPTSPPDSPPSPTIPITRITWHEEDALPFPLCISHKSPDSLEVNEHISVVQGNIALVDHGMTFVDENGEDDLFENLISSVKPIEVPFPKKEYAASAHSHCNDKKNTPVNPRYNPVLGASPLTFSAADTLSGESQVLSGLYSGVAATAMLKQESRKAKPQIQLFEIIKNRETDSPEWINIVHWEPQSDLLNDSDGNSNHFVVETDEEGKSHIRFGDDINGKLPNAGTRFLAQFRTGNGSSGNVGAGAISHLVTQQGVVIRSITNPLPAFGGKDPETLEEVRQYAPEAFRTQERAVTKDDYEHFSKVCKPDIQNSTAAFRWTGSWHTAFVSVDRLEDKPVDGPFETELRNCLEKYRMAGMDLEVDAPIHIGLELEMEVCIRQEYFQSDIRKELLAIFSNRRLAGGQTGIFHPDNYSFGQPVYLSGLYAAAQSVEGVTSVKVLKFNRQEDTDESGIESGMLEFNRREIPRLDNDPNFKDRGVFNLILKGGR